MNRIADSFENLRKQGKKALVPFITAGDPRVDATLPLMQALVRGGADLLELGVPFSDPMADGPVIQRSSERALRHGTSLGDVLDIVAGFREENTTTPVILMGYLNPIEVMGYEKFSRRARAAGVDGVLVVDLPPEEADALQAELKRHDLCQIFLLSPTTRGERLEQICAKAGGFLYYVSLKGVTGSNRLNLDEVTAKIAQVRTKTSLPVGVGFGIKDADTAKAVAGFSDAVIVGSSLVERLEQLGPAPIERLARTAEEFLAVLRAAVDTA
ncbi:MAG: tryptophan synthase subunit alpha [Gammaproteobacteria bacterium]